MTTPEDKARANEVHVMPINDIKKHIDAFDCWCNPEYKDGIFVHRVFSDKYPENEREIKN